MQNSRIFAIVLMTVLAALPAGKLEAQSGVEPPARETLVRERLDVTDPKMSLFILNLAAGVTVPTHSHAGAVFAYVLAGEIENQIHPEPPKVYRAGGYFHERPDADPPDLSKPEQRSRRGSSSSRTPAQYLRE